MLLKILQSGDDGLRQPARALTKAQLSSKKIQTLIDLMIATLDDAPGVGLAAPQVGELLQLIVIHDNKEYHEQVPAELLKEQSRKPIPVTIIANPKLKVVNSESTTYFEGCLSVEGYLGAVARAKQVHVTGWDRHGKEISVDAAGWYARILQHEVDHLVGRLYIDQMNTKSFMSLRNFSMKWRKALTKEIESKFT